jgi:hypothetical protein
MKRSEVLPAVKALLEEIPGGIPVVIDDYSRAASQKMDAFLLTGHCLALKPLLSSKRTSQAGARVAEHVNFTVHVRVNPEKIVTGFSAYDLHDAIIAKLCGSLSLSAKAGTTEGDSSSLLPEDLGLLSHALFFHVLITNL